MGGVAEQRHRAATPALRRVAVEQPMGKHRIGGGRSDRLSYRGAERLDPLQQTVAVAGRSRERDVPVGTAAGEPQQPGDAPITPPLARGEFARPSAVPRKATMPESTGSSEPITCSRVVERRPSAPTIRSAPISASPVSRTEPGPTSTTSAPDRNSPPDAPKAAINASWRSRRWMPTSGASKRLSISAGSKAASGVPSARRRAPSLLGTPGSSTTAPSPSERRALTPFGQIERPEPVPPGSAARSRTVTSQPDLPSTIPAARPPIPAPTTIADREASTSLSG